MDSKLDFFQRMYALNDDYHNKKERMAWLATTLYLSFVLVSTKWLVDNGARWIDFWPGVIEFLALVCLVAFWFIMQQIKLKARSALLTGKMQEFVPQFDSPVEPSFAQIGEACKLPDRAGVESWGPTFLCLPAVIVFFLAQVAAMLLFGDP